MRSLYGRPRPISVFTLTALLLAISALTGCSNVSLYDNGFITAISTDSSTVRVNQKLQVANHIKLTGVPLQFSVNGIPGGNSIISSRPLRSINMLERLPAGSVCPTARFDKSSRISATSDQARI